MPTTLPVVLVRVPPPGGKGRHKLTKREAAGGLFFGLVHATGFALAGAYFNDEAVWFVATVSEAKDEETGGSVVGLEFRAQNRDQPLVVVEHADDLVTALLIAIDDNL